MNKGHAPSLSNARNTHLASARIGNSVGGHARAVGNATGRSGRVGWAFALAVAAAAVSACSDQANANGETTLSCDAVTNWSYDPVDFYTMDTVFVLDRSAGASGYGDAVATHLGQFGRLLEVQNDIGVHLGIVAADGGEMRAVPGSDDCVAPADPFVEHVYEPWFRCDSEPGFPCASRNFEGSLESVLPCLGTLPTLESAAPRPLEAAVNALDAAPSRFGQDNAGSLGLLIISVGDDSSPLRVEDYVDRLAARAGDLDQLLLAVVAPAGAERLQRLTEQVPNAVFVDIEQADWSLAHDPLLSRHVLLPYTCLEKTGRDADPQNPGLQPRCEVVADPDESSEPVPACKMETPTRPAADSPWPCWWIGPDSGGCSTYPHVEGLTSTTWECVVPCEDVVAP